MNQIINDALYIISLHQKECKNINISRLTHLLFLAEGYNMNIQGTEYLYENPFYLDLLSIYSKEINIRFIDFISSESIMLTPQELKTAESISKERKKELDDIYSYFRDTK